MNRNAIWVRKFANGRIGIIRVENDFEDYKYIDDNWVPIEPRLDLG